MPRIAHWTVAAGTELVVHRSSKFAQRGACGGCGASLFIRYDCEAHTDWVHAACLTDQRLLPLPSSTFHIHCAKELGQGRQCSRGFEPWQCDPCRPSTLPEPAVCRSCYQLECTCSNTGEAAEVDDASDLHLSEVHLCATEGKAKICTSAFVFAPCLEVREAEDGGEEDEDEDGGGGSGGGGGGGGDDDDDDDHSSAARADADGDMLVPRKRQRRQRQRRRLCRMRGGLSADGSGRETASSETSGGWAGGGVLRVTHTLATPLENVGLQVWRGALVLCDWLLAYATRRLIEGATVLELGAGCGLTSLAAVTAGARCVLCTDHGQTVLENAARNAAAHRCYAGTASAGLNSAEIRGEIRVRKLDWFDCTSHQPSKAPHGMASAYVASDPLPGAPAPSSMPIAFDEEARASETGETGDAGDAGGSGSSSGSSSFAWLRSDEAELARCTLLLAADVRMPPSNPAQTPLAPGCYRCSGYRSECWCD